MTWSKWFVVLGFATVGLINALPVIGALSPERFQSLYGIAVDDPELWLLLRHRALLFGIVGGLLLVAAALPNLRNVATAAGLVSMLSFVVFFAVSGVADGSLAKIARVDIAASVLLIAAAAVHHYSGVTPS